MVNFGYGPTSKGWNDHKKWDLAGRFNELLETMRNEGRITTEQTIASADGLAPYVEVNQLYQGVRIRKITHLTNEQMDDLITEAEKIYKEVMWESKSQGQGQSN